MTQMVLHHIDLILHGIIATLHLSRYGCQPITRRGQTLDHGELIIEFGVDIGEAGVDNLIPVTIKRLLVGRLLVQLEELAVYPSQFLRHLPQVAIGDILVLLLLFDRLP